MARPMPVVLTVVAALFALSLACDEATPVSVDTVESRPTEIAVPSAEPTQEAPATATAAPIRADTALTSLPNQANATGTPTSETSSDPRLQENVLSSDEPAPPMCSPSDPNVVTTSSPASQPLREGTESVATGVVHVGFPAWVDDCPKLATSILGSDVIARVRFVHLDSAIEERESLGFFVDLKYTFEALEYLKGSGPEQIVVRLNSGPTYEAFPDWLGYRTEGEARQLESSWHSRNLVKAHRASDAILLVARPGADGVYSFEASDRGRGQGGEPIMGETWLRESGLDTYTHGFAGGADTKISLTGLTALISSFKPIPESEYSSCVYVALSIRQRVREQILGTYRRLTLGGYTDPIPFPKYSVTLDPENPYGFPLRLERPPYAQPRCSHYWLDGPDKELFATNTHFFTGNTLEIVSTTAWLPPGQYHVHYGQYHTSISGSATVERNANSWGTWDVLELVITVPE